jgi:hypothetical protein
MKVNLRGIHGLVSEPQCDNRTVHAMLQSIHRGAVSEHMWRYTFGF